MTIGAAELKLSFDVFSKILNWASGRRSSKALEKLKSEAYRELLKGNSADIAKVAAAIRKLRKSGDSSADTERLEILARNFVSYRQPWVEGEPFKLTKSKSGKHAATGKSGKVTAKRAKGHMIAVKKSAKKSKRLSISKSTAKGIHADNVST